MTNPWHDVSFGEKAPDVVNAIIEVPKNSMLKYELDKETGLIRLDRVLYSAVHYPGDYGFIPRTLWEDGDPLDIIILSNFPVYPKTIVSVRPIGVLHMTDDEENDHKIIAVHATDPRFDRYKDLKDVPEHILKEIKNFFETYKELQKQKVKVLSLHKASDAKKHIHEAILNYKKKYK